MNILIHKTESVKLNSAQQKEVAIYYLQSLLKGEVSNEKILTTESQGNGHYETITRPATENELAIAKALDVLFHSK